MVHLVFLPGSKVSFGGGGGGVRVVNSRGVLTQHIMCMCLWDPCRKMCPFSPCLYYNCQVKFIKSPITLIIHSSMSSPYTQDINFDYSFILPQGRVFSTVSLRDPLQTEFSTLNVIVTLSSDPPPPRPPLNIMLGMLILLKFCKKL